MRNWIWPALALLVACPDGRDDDSADDDDADDDTADDDTADDDTSVDEAESLYDSREAAIADGVLGWFAFDETGGTVLSSAVGGWTGTVLGGEPADGRVGGGWHRGSVAADGFKLELPGVDRSTFSVAFWWMPTDMAIYSPTDGAGIVWLTPEVVEHTIGMNGVPEANRLRWGPSLAGADTMDGGYTLVQNAWHHIVLTADAVEARLFVDGQERATVPTADYAWRLRAEIWVANYVARSGNPNNHFGRGTIDELVLWDRPLSDAQVAALHRAGEAGLPLY